MTSCSGTASTQTGTCGDWSVSFLVDTDICSAYLKGNHAVWQRFMQHGGQRDVSAISVAELFSWVLRANASPRRLQGLTDLLKDVTFLRIDEDVSRRFGEPIWTTVSSLQSWICSSPRRRWSMDLRW